MHLVGDIGGTKTILALFDQDNHSNWFCKHRQLFASGDYPVFDELLKNFIFSYEVKSVKSVCLGVAGPIVNGECVTTNLPWVLQRNSIGRIANTNRVFLLNDLEATAWGVMGLPNNDFVELNINANASENGTIAVIAAGTGLGEAIITGDSHHRRVLATEGGHCDFAPIDAQQIALLEYLINKYQGHVSYERVLSGEGLNNIYQFLRDTRFCQVNPATEDRMKINDPAAVIGQLGVAGEDKLCEESLNLFCRIYGAEAGNLALKCLSKQGLYITGGIAVKILPVIKKGEFLNRFFQKGRSQALLEGMSIKVCMKQDVALLGALEYLKLNDNG